MTKTFRICDLCRFPWFAGSLGWITLKIEGASPTWEVCGFCCEKPFRRPSAADRVETEMRMANLLKEEAGKLFVSAVG